MEQKKKSETSGDNNDQKTSIPIPSSSRNRDDTETSVGGCLLGLNSVPVQKIARQAFWDLLESDLNNSPPDYTHAFVLLTEIKELLLGFLPKENTITKNSINESLDIDLMRQKAENGILDIRKYADFIVSVMLKLCAQIRDDRIKAISSITDIVPLYKEIYEVIELMKLDMANFQIAMIRPRIQQQSVDYEKQKFGKFLTQQSELGIDGLQSTKSWLKRSHNRLQMREDKEISASRILNAAYVDLLDWNPANEYPEGYLQDRYTSELRLKLKSEIEILLNDVHDRDLKDKLKNVSVYVQKAVSENCSNQKTIPTDFENVISKQITSLADDDSRIRLLLTERLMKFLSEILSGSPNCSEQSSGPSTSKSTMQLPQGFSAFTAELTDLSKNLHRLVTHNRAVFGGYYDNIIKDLLT